MGVKLSLSKEGKNRPRVHENRMLRRIFGPNTEDMTESCIMTSFITSTLH